MKPCELNLPELREAAYIHTKQSGQLHYFEEPITYNEFFTKCLLPNKICVLGPWATATWPSRHDWVKDDRINWTYLLSNFGSAQCPVADCSSVQFDSHCKTDMSFSDFVHYMGSSSRSKLLYLKDWHFFKLFPDYTAFTLPPFFSSDWLNEFCDAKTKDDYRFVYIGPQGSWTGFHSDVLRSYSWSANIIGCKKWLFFPPGEEEIFRDEHNNLPFDVRDDGHGLTLIQRSGEIVFVPSGWHHQVWNLEDTISINHNWINSCALDLTLNWLLQSLSRVECELQDVKDMDGWTDQCQLVLASCEGMNLTDLYLWIKFIVFKRLSALSGNTVDDKTMLQGPSPVLLQNSKEGLQQLQKILQNSSQDTSSNLQNSDNRCSCRNENGSNSVHDSSLGCGSHFHGFVPTEAVHGFVPTTAGHGTDEFEPVHCRDVDGGTVTSSTSRSLGGQGRGATIYEDGTSGNSAWHFTFDLLRIAEILPILLNTTQFQVVQHDAPAPKQLLNFLTEWRERLSKK